MKFFSDKQILALRTPDPNFSPTRDGHMYNRGWNDAISKIVYYQKPADVREIKWVPVKERLPEEKNEKYWVCTDTGYQCECRWTNVNRFWSQLKTDWHWNIVDIPQYSEVIAWMPLPEPYREVEE